MQTNLASAFIEAAGQTFYMASFSCFFAMLLGFPLGIGLAVSAPKGIGPCRPVHLILGFIVNIGRSAPFIIILIAVLPLTKLIVGTSIGSTAAIVPLALSGAPFFARIVEAALKEGGLGLIEAGRAMGASKKQIIFCILLPEAKRALILGSSLLIVGLIGNSAMAGAVGGGGLGAMAYNYGYLRFQSDVTYIAIAILVALVQILQSAGDALARRAPPKN